jgi:O-acetyl-ADP-ribose deacetylase (regulator of RNase III)
VDAIVNAANESLLGGGGVDGAIHAAAGPRLREECQSLGGCRTGEAKLTRGYELPAQWVIHTVGPVWRGGHQGEEDALRGCYRACFGIAREKGLASLAFPSISTGAYRYPLAEAARIAVDEILRGLRENPRIEVTVVCFGPDVVHAYEGALASST